MTQTGAAASGPRRLLLVAGSGRSGTSVLASTLQMLGAHIPGPEVLPDETNPKGFGESQWVVDFHDRLLRRSNVRVTDARPQAWFDAGRMSTLERVREELSTWLAEQYADDVREVVIKDPRLAWFLGLWRSAALRHGVEQSYVVMLRPPTEVVGSKQKYYNATLGETGRMASWVNAMLHTERATRGGRRAFVHYHDLLDDWTRPVYALGERLGIESVRSASATKIRRVHDLIDPSLHRVRTTWDDLDVPKGLRELADETWEQLVVLADQDLESPSLHASLDDLRARYTQYYEEAEAIAQSSVLAAARQKRKPTDGSKPDPAPVPPATGLSHRLRRAVRPRGRSDRR
ncbi:sulfotransferase family protein [Nocardioides guangzhouensis]|uniref:Sulfotransferase family protein n=1 Tax=Nocardioides guangzhouensis TaxID=2497878 RepID=A0A4Q4Z710_9ACTN|nr:sulfotransferase family protein [Nocardioides guangzhouensis]RYP83165.1 sulfotransferase family protein [Nocardioides guangzhouensis]